MTGHKRGVCMGNARFKDRVHILRRVRLILSGSRGFFAIGWKFVDSGVIVICRNAYLSCLFIESSPELPNVMSGDKLAWKFAPTFAASLTGIVPIEYLFTAGSILFARTL